MTNPNINIKFVFNNRDSPIKLSHILSETSRNFCKYLY